VQDDGIFGRMSHAAASSFHTRRSPGPARARSSCPGSESGDAVFAHRNRPLARCQRRIGMAEEDDGHVRIGGCIAQALRSLDHSKLGKQRAAPS
jgi:hypothetical protein